MGNDLYLKKIIKYVDELFGEKDQHFVRTLFWVCYLKPEANEILKIAAYAHDVERAICPYNIAAFLLDKEVLRLHQENGAAAIYDFLINEGVDNDSASKVRELIRKHEIGGNHEQNVLKDADSISYFETNSIKHIAWIDKFSKNEIKAKFDWMFDRISLYSAKKIAEPIYNKVLKLLETAGS